MAVDVAVAVPERVPESEGVFVADDDRGRVGELVDDLVRERVNVEERTSVSDLVPLVVLVTVVVRVGEGVFVMVTGLLTVAARVGVRVTLCDFVTVAVRVPVVEWLGDAEVVPSRVLVGVQLAESVRVSELVRGSVGDLVGDAVREAVDVRLGSNDVVPVRDGLFVPVCDCDFVALCSCVLDPVPESDWVLESVAVWLAKIVSESVLLDVSEPVVVLVAVTVLERVKDTSPVMECDALSEFRYGGEHCIVT